MEDNIKNRIRERIEQQKEYFEIAKQNKDFERMDKAYCVIDILYSLLDEV